MTAQRESARFTTNMLLAALNAVLFVMVFYLYVVSERKIDDAHSLRFETTLYADELRDASEALTRAARSFVITGDPKYRRHYRDILDARDGKRPMPQYDDQPDWDMVRLDEPPLEAFSKRTEEMVALWKRHQLDLEGLHLLKQAKQASDKLVQTEMEAMRQVAAAEPVTDEIRVRASEMLHDERYMSAKLEIMRPINEFNQLIDQRTQATVQRAMDNATICRAMFATLGAFFLILLLRSHRNLHAILGDSPESLFERIVALGKGEFAPVKPVPRGLEHSVAGWLAHTRDKLARIDAERRDAHDRAQHAMHLYAALNHANQAILRSASKEQMLAEICRGAVVYGGMKMAWIGLVDQGTKRVRPVATFGEHLDYVARLDISVDPVQQSAYGPTGTAIRTNRPVWVDDFQSSPDTAPWRQPSGRHRWGSSAALPLHHGGEVVGAFNLYSAEVDAFDEDIQDLLIEMASDIDYALDAFEREAERQHVLRLEEFRLFVLERLTEKVPLSIILQQIAQRIEALLPGRLCSILTLEPEGERLKVAAAPSLPEFYNQAVDGLGIGAGIGACGNTAHSGQPTIVENIAHDPAWESYRDVCRRAGVAACWSYPIVTSNKQVLGTFAIYARTPSVPDRDAEQLIETTSRLIALAIDSKRYEDRIQYLAHFDSLTSLPNRMQLQEQAHYLLPRADRAGTSVALLFIDIDRFQHVNDSFGHGVGDSLLMQLADRLQHAVRDDDTLARFGGDEFVVMLPDTDAHGATVVSQKLLDMVRQPTRIEQFDMSVTASIGIALYPGDAHSFDELLKQADSAMHRAKRDNGGGGGFRFYSGEMQALSMRYLKVEAALRAGLERRQLFLQYQPQIDLKTGKVTGAEALMRFHHPDLGVVSPDEFIKVAEETGLIQSIGEWALREAVRQTREWLDAGLPLKTIAVNLSAVQFHHEGLAQMIAEVLEQAKLPAECLELELTESTAMRDPQAAIALMRELHDRGIGLAIDDFGTGYSSLSCLKRFQLSKLKIDKSFVRDIDSDPDDRAIVSAVINVARELGIRTIAEGVETEGQLRFLAASGCGAVQGFLFSKPLMAAEFEAYCRSSIREPATIE